MYLNFFKFKKSPFHITPDPEYLFLSPSHQEASASILYGIEQRKGFIAITGEVGVGKTTILRTYLEGTDPEKLRIVYIFNAALSYQKLLKQIFLELGIPIVDEEPSELVNSLFHYLIEEYANGRNIILIVDEAQNMPVETLEHMRMLSNLETSKDKLLQIVMVGQPEFENKLNLPELRQLKQRVAIRCRINALTTEESLAYIQHRIMKASMFHNPVFTKGALKRIVKESKGIPRTINILCDNALITAFGYQRKPVDLKIVKEVIADMLGRRPKGFFRWRTAIITALATVMAFMFLIFQEDLISEKTTLVKEAPPAQIHATINPAPPQGAPEPKIEKTEDTTFTEPAAPPVLEQPKEVPAEIERPVLTFPDPRQIFIEETVTSIEPLVQRPAKNTTTRVVKRGDSIFGVLTSAYGRVDPELVKSFRDLNPHIENLDRIKPGETILLPSVDKSKQRAE